MHSLPHIFEMLPRVSSPWETEYLTVITNTPNSEEILGLFHEELGLAFEP